DPVTLQSLTSIKVLPQANGVTSKPGGLLFLLDGLAPDFQGCCALYALDLQALKPTKLLEPVSAAVVSPDGQHVLAQRGAVGIEFFGTRSLQHEPGIPRPIAPGNYSLHFSPDGQLLYGTSNFPTPSLDVFDFEQRKLVARLSVRQDLIVRGEWVGDDYYLYGRSKDRGQLWRVKPDNSALGEPVKISFP